MDFKNGLPGMQNMQLGVIHLVQTHGGIGQRRMVVYEGLVMAEDMYFYNSANLFHYSLPMLQFTVFCNLASDFLKNGPGQLCTF